MPSEIRVDVHLEPDAMLRSLEADVRAGLAAAPKTLPPKWFYDDRGSELFDEITRLPEYYPTRAERSILAERAGTIAERTGADTLVELGSGTSEKTRLLLDAFAGAGTLASLRSLRRQRGDAPERRRGDRPRVRRRRGARGRRRLRTPSRPDPHAADAASSRSSAAPSATSRPAERAKFLAEVAAVSHRATALLLGTDLVKDVDRLVAAYDDAAGVTAEFNRNVLRVLNRKLDADFDVDAFAHVALLGPDRRVDRDAPPRRARAGRDHRALSGWTCDFAAGEELRTEISAKFRPEGVERELAAAGLRLTEWWTDAAGDFALSLSTPVPDRRAPGVS